MFLRKIIFPVKTQIMRNGVFNTHMHKMGSRRSKHYIFGDQFYSKNSRMLTFHEFFQFYARKHIISSFYLKWTEFTRNSEFCSNSVWVPKTNNWNKIYNFLEVRSNLGKIMITYVFEHENGGIRGIWAFLHFLSKTGCQKYCAYVLGTQRWAASAVWCLYLKKYTNFLNQTITP